MSRKADEIQMYAYTIDFKRFYDATKTIYGPQQSGTSPVLSADGSKLNDDHEHEILNWLAEHFNAILNLPSSIYSDAINNPSQVEIN